MPDTVTSHCQAAPEAARAIERRRRKKKRKKKKTEAMDELVGPILSTHGIFVPAVNTTEWAAPVQPEL